MKRRLISLFANFLQRRTQLARIDFPRQGRSYLVPDDGKRVVEFAALCDVDLGDEIVLRTRGGQSTHYRVRGQVTKEHRMMLTQARMLMLVTPRYAIVASEA